MLQNQAERTYLLNEEALGYLAAVGLSAAVRRRLTALPRDGPQPEAAFTAWLTTHLPTLGTQQERWIREAAAVAAYHAQTAIPVVDVLLGDDAPQCKGVTAALALCWVHDARHSKKGGRAVGRPPRRLDLRKQDRLRYPVRWQLWYNRAESGDLLNAILHRTL